MMEVEQGERGGLWRPTWPSRQPLVNMISPDAQRLERRPHILWSITADGILCVDGTSGETFTLNATAGLIWEMLAEPRAEHEICAELAEKSDIDATACRAAIGDLLERRAAGLERPLEPLTLDSVLALREDLVVSEMDGELFMPDRGNDAYVALGASGSRIVDRIDGVTPVGVIVDALTAIYDVDPQTCAEQVIEFLAALRRAGLLDKA